jgi:putative transposase
MDTVDKHGHLHRKGSVSLVRYHLIWIPRRRRKVLVGPVAERLATLLHEKAAEMGLGVLRLAIQPDHLHLFVTAPPDVAPAHIAFRLKGYTARVLRQEFPHLRRMPSMWTTSSFVSTAGNVSAQTIERYMQAQSTRA